MLILGRCWFRVFGLCGTHQSGMRQPRRNRRALNRSRWNEICHMAYQTAEYFSSADWIITGNW